MFDSILALSWWELFFCLAVIFLITFEVAFRLSQRRRVHASEPGQANAVLLLGSLLALVGILLAFSFNIADTRFQGRRQLVLEEANAILTTYLRADVLPAPHTAKVRSLLRRYVDIRLDIKVPADLEPAIRASESIHRELWSAAMASTRENPESRTIPLFIESLNNVLDLHEERLAYAAYFRLPVPMLVGLFVVALLSMAILGHVAAMAGSRSFWPSLAVIASVTAVLVLVVELDRPWAHMFNVSQAALVDVQKVISSTQ